MEGTKVKSVRLGKIRVDSDSTTTGMRVTFPVVTETGEHELWFETPEGQLVIDRCDAAVVAVLPLAMLQGYDTIESEIPISEELYYNLTYHVIPQLQLGGIRAKELKINAPRTGKTFNTSGVGTGMSLGIDSFATLSEYAHPIDAPNYTLTHLTYFNVGAHHGTDLELGHSELTPRELYEGQLIRVREFCQEYGYKLLVLDSNLSPFLRRAFRKSFFNWTHTYRNAAAALMLQNSLGTYFYSSAINLDLFQFSLRSDTAAYEKWLLPYLSTGSIRFFNSNRAWSRFEKTRIVSQVPESYRYLTVCLLDVRNCGRCMKCRKTLLALDALGDDVLDLYHESFDLDEYRRVSRPEWFGSIYSRMAKPGLPGEDMKEIYRAAQRRGATFLPSMGVEREAAAWEVGRISVPTASVRVEPHESSVEILRVPHMYAVQLLGERSGWFKIRRDGLVGYIDAKDVALLQPRELEKNTIGIVEAPTPLYALPSRQSLVVEELRGGSILSVLRSLKNFYFVENEDGTKGWTPISSVTFPSN